MVKLTNLFTFKIVLLGRLMFQVMISLYQLIVIIQHFDIIPRNPIFSVNSSRNYEDNSCIFIGMKYYVNTTGS
jgi:hypothetical protein